MSTMRVAQVTRPGAPFEIVERPVADPGPGEVRLRVEACGVCHSDVLTRMALFPGIELPRVPGHEVIGRIDAIGANVQGWSIGDRVGVGWHGGQCGLCEPCRRGDFFACRTFRRVTGVTTDGGYGEFMHASQTALARVPTGLSAEEAAPLMFAPVRARSRARRRWSADRRPSTAPRQRSAATTSSACCSIAASAASVWSPMWPMRKV